MRIPRWFLQKFGCTFPISNILTLVAISTTDNLKLDIDIFPLTIAVMTSSLGVATEVIFFSRLWHEVLPSERVRRALTLWILRPEEEESWIPAVFWFAFWPWRSCSLRNMEKRMFLHRTTAKAQVVMLWSVWSIVKLRELRCPSATLIDESGEREELAMGAKPWWSGGCRGPAQRGMHSYDRRRVMQGIPSGESAGPATAARSKTWFLVPNYVFCKPAYWRARAGLDPRAIYYWFWSWHCAWQWSLRSGDSLHGGKFQEVQYPGAVQESKSPTFDDVTIGGDFMFEPALELGQDSTQVGGWAWMFGDSVISWKPKTSSWKQKASSWGQDECSDLLFHGSRVPMQLQSAMCGHISLIQTHEKSLAIWFAKPVSRQAMTNEQGARKHLVARLAHVCIWICVDLDLRDGQEFPACFRLRKWIWSLRKECTRCTGPCGFFAVPTSILFSNAKWFQTYQMWPAMWSCWVSESKDSKHLQSFSVVLCTIRRCQIIWGEPLCSMGSRKGWTFLFYKHLDMSSQYRIPSLKSQHCRVHRLRRNIFWIFWESHIIHCSKETQTQTNNCLSRSSFIWGFKASRCPVFVLSKHFLVKAFSWFFLASGSFWIPLLYIDNLYYIYLYYTRAYFRSYMYTYDINDILHMCTLK